MAVGVAPGIVQYAERQSSGVVVRVRHAAYDTLYLHLHDAYVSAGQTIAAGTPVGALGGDPRPGRGRPYGADPYSGAVYGFVHLHLEYQTHDRVVLDPRRIGDVSPSDGGAAFDFAGWLAGLDAMAPDLTPALIGAAIVGAALLLSEVS
jgi:murein DD-endopeptidase MepM/ murein hydrolase activator NlpD